MAGEDLAVGNYFWRPRNLGTLTDVRYGSSKSTAGWGGDAAKGRL
jgi:hypothetical protein